MKQLFSSTLVVVMVIVCCYGSVSALEAPDTRASLTLSSYNVGLTAGDSAGMISISYDVQSNKLASSIGVETVDIYKADGSYVTSITGSTSNGLIETNSDICKSYYDCQLTSGIFYYANVKVFAKVGSEYDSRVITTSTVNLTYLLSGVQKGVTLCANFCVHTLTVVNAMQSVNNIDRLQEKSGISSSAQKNPMA